MQPKARASTRGAAARAGPDARGSQECGAVAHLAPQGVQLLGGRGVEALEVLHQCLPGGGSTEWDKDKEEQWVFMTRGMVLKVCSLSCRKGGPGTWIETHRTAAQ